MRNRSTAERREGAGAGAGECGGGLGELLSPRLFRALGDPSRIAIVVQMGQEGRPMSVSDVAGCCPVSLSVVSRHLSQLRESGVVEARREGKQVIYRLRAAEVARGLRALADALEACCPEETTCGPACATSCAPAPSRRGSSVSRGTKRKSRGKKESR